MSSFLCITVRFLQPWSHGRGEDGGPEWPPSPLRLMQALVAAAAGRWNERSILEHAKAAIRWLEALPPPYIVAAPTVPSSQPYRLYVPDNVADKVAAAWSRGREASIADYRTEKDVLSSVIEGEAVHYLYALSQASAPRHDLVDVLTNTARSITHLGWGIDMATGDASVLIAEQVGRLQGIRWRPSLRGGTPLRMPKPGTLDDLIRKHTDFLNRVTRDGFRPVPPLRVFDVVRYRRQDQPIQRPYRVFELRNIDGSRFRYSHRKLVHIAGMLRHLAIEAMKASLPAGVDGDWVEAYVAGHVTEREREHRQLSYLPLPSIGHQHTDPGVRRVMVAAPLGDDVWLDHVARRLAGQVLKPLRGDEFGGGDPPLLVPMKGDNVSRRYTDPTDTWHSFTPVILPGHDDHKPAKTRKLIEIALRQADVNQPCEFEWGAFSRFPKSLTAHKYDRQKSPTGYIRPDHLLSQTAVHLTLRFRDGLKVPGPLAIGAGRHCGLGLMAGMDEQMGR
ncbi:MAG: type I-U CRISPR-associated protein Cas5/Cas6 [Rhodopirellula sp.]|nr:type I-U CRISPR-associated protein Cas5/Cas6 [Rhodopirellula sp.]